MTQPRFVPMTDSDEVREGLRLEPPRRWRADRVAELRAPGFPRGNDLGAPGPDPGYALLLAEQLFAERLELGPGESAHDAVEGAAAVGGARAAGFGRAPVAADIEHALSLFGYLDPDVPAELAAWRCAAFRGVAHDYRRRRALVDRVPESTLRLSAERLAAKLATPDGWRSLLVFDDE